MTSTEKDKMRIMMIIGSNKPLGDDGLNDILFTPYTSSYNRFYIFLQAKHLLKGSVYWRGLNTAYTSSDNLYDYTTKARKCFESNEPNREELMSENERQYLDNLPDKVTIYRGMTVKEKENGKFGVSWTLNESVAKWFIEVYIRNHKTDNKPKTIVKLEVDKSQIVAVFLGRKEFEVIYL